MGIAITLREYLDGTDFQYDVLPHIHTGSSSETAQASNISGDHIAKAVILEDESGYLMAVIPATHRVDLGVLHKKLGRRVGLATETELEDLFMDCEPGAVPPLGQAYGIDVVVDDSLKELDDVYFEGGDHYDLVHLKGDDFAFLMEDAKHGAISHHV